MSGQKTVGEMLITLLERHGVDTVFGIPGVHTAELYRGLAASPIRHVTPRSEQDAGFMADGYARVTGRPGVCLLITGPGVTNAITPMAQARADSIPMLVVSGVNAAGRYSGRLHELPDQAATMRTIALSSERLERPQDLPDLVARAFSGMRGGRPGPVHIEIPTDLMEAPVGPIAGTDVAAVAGLPVADPAALDRATALCAAASAPLVIAGGGAAFADEAIRALAERLDAPVITTTNARGILAGHTLGVPASPCLAATRRLMAEADLVVAIGTEFGPTDFDPYVDGGFVPPENLVRIDVDKDAAVTIPASVFIHADAGEAAAALAARLSGRQPTTGAARAEKARADAFAGLSPKMRAMVEVLAAIRDAVPDCTMVGDSTQLAYAGNLWWDAAAPRRWFNAATGYGALGYGPPAAVGAGIALGRAPVVCLVGDGGFQFCLGALGAASDEKAPVIFVVWNNHGYQEIEDYMVARGIAPVGVRPLAPDFTAVAAAYGIPAERVRFTEAAPDLGPLAAALRRAREATGPALVEIVTP